MMDTSRFDQIRPYVNKDIPSAMNRIADSVLFSLIASYVFPNANIEDVRRHIRGIETINIDELHMLESMIKQESFKTVACLIDKRINASFYLHPNNYIVFDIRYGTKRKYTDRYTLKQKEAFCEILKKLSTYEGCELDVLMDVFSLVFRPSPINSRSKAISFQ